MRLAIWVIGKTDFPYLVEGISIYLNRLTHYVKTEYEELKDVKPGKDEKETSRLEAEMISQRLKSDDILILLDEKGKSLDSVAFSTFIEKFQVQSAKRIIFLIGGAFGHHLTIRSRANYSISLSQMTFSHQMVRLILVEQLYRAFTIIKNEKYHNS
jgi:23S rRNA (pseudouridine1915-N3)-methyltransferase